MSPPAPAGPGALRARLVGRAIACALRLQALTWRRRLVGLERIEALAAARRRVLVLFWHGKYVPLFALLRVGGGCIFTSRSRRGDVVREISRRFGHESIEIPEHDGEAALALMSRALVRVRLAATAADGPLGPPREVKRRLIELASRTSAAVLPVSVASRRHRVLAERWDRMEIPRPFTRVHLEVGAPIEPPRGLDALGIETWVGRVRAALEAVDARVEYAARAGTTPHRG